MALSSESLTLETPGTSRQTTQTPGISRPALRSPRISGQPTREKEVGSTRQSKHVLFLIDRFVSVRMGGAERALLRTTRLLPKYGYQCSVVTFEGDPRYQDLRSPFDCPFHIFPMKRSYDANALRMGIRLARFIRSQRIDVVHTFFATSDLWGGSIARLSRCPVLISSRRDMGIERSFKHNLAYRLLGRMFDQVQTVSDQVRSYSIDQDGLDPSKVVTLHNGIDLDDIEAMPALNRVELGLENASHVIVAVGNIRPVKGIDVLLQAMVQVCKKYPKAVLAIVGGVNNQQYFSSLEELIVSLGLKQNVKFLGYRSQAIETLKSCDVYCQSSRSEGLPNSLLEAMACGLPCVATSVGGTPEIIADDSNGFLVPPENPRLIADRILGLLRDPQRARAIGEAGRRTVADRFTTEMMVQRLVTCYEEIFSRK
jgi:L-malate glycosyltransferase